MRKKIIIIILVLIVSLSIVKLYQTYAISSSVAGDNDNYTVNLNGNTSVVVPAGGSKTVYYKIRNTNNGTVRYGVGYKSTSIVVKVYLDSESANTGLINKEENKFIKLYLENTTSSSETVYLTIILGYENGGNLIAPSGYRLVTEEYSNTNYDGYAEATVKRLGLSLGEGTPDFTTVSGDAGEDIDSGDAVPGDGTVGLYKTIDDLGTSYYFRGYVENNYVYFADFYWRIIRINGDGTVRMIYAGTEAHYNGDDTTDVFIDNVYYNETADDNTYVGYMTGTAGASTYADTHSNKEDSTIKKTVDAWYKNNISGTTYEQYIADAVYCNDRSIANDEETNNYFKSDYEEDNIGTGIGKDTTVYSAMKRNEVDYTPSLKCFNRNDRFTRDSSIGNQKLTYPVGLITADEIALSGMVARTNSLFVSVRDNYLYNGDAYSFWSMTPLAFSSNAGSSVVYYFAQDANFFSALVASGEVSGVRPVISLKADAITGGNGTMDNPFTVG